MARYRFVGEVETVFTHLRRVTGETVDVRPGEVVDVHPDDDEHAQQHLGALLEATDAPATPWPPAQPVTPVDPAMAAAAEAALAQHAKDQADADAARVLAAQQQLTQTVFDAAEHDTPTA